MVTKGRGEETQRLQARMGRTETAERPHTVTEGNLIIQIGMEEVRMFQSRKERALRLLARTKKIGRLKAKKDGARRL